jgi:hypothetical protein
MGFEHRLFECPKCNSVQNEVIASDVNQKAKPRRFTPADSALDGPD